MLGRLFFWAKKKYKNEKDPRPFSFRYSVFFCGHSSVYVNGDYFSVFVGIFFLFPPPHLSYWVLLYKNGQLWYKVNFGVSSAVWLPLTSIIWDSAFEKVNIKSCYTVKDRCGSLFILIAFMLVCYLSHRMDSLLVMIFYMYVMKVLLSSYPFSNFQLILVQI